MTSLRQAIEFGRSTAYLAISVGFAATMVAGILVNYFAARRHGTNRKCAWAAVWLFTGGLVLGLGEMIAQWVKLEPLLRSLPSLCAFVALIIAVFLALAGLGEMKRFPGRFTRGRKRAISVLTVPVLIALGVVAAVCVHTSGHPIFGAQIGGTAGEIVNNKSWNFQLVAPPPWASVDAAKVNPGARAALARQGPQMFSMVLAEDLSKSGPPPLETVIAGVKAKLKEEAHGEIVADEKQDENGLQGRRIESLATSDGKPFFYVHWLTNYDETYYQVITWGSPLARDEVRAESRKLTAGFRILDAKVTPIAETERVDPIFSSEDFGYRIDLSNTVWSRRWPSLANDVPAAQFGVLNAHGTAAFCVVPIWIGDDDANIEALTAALAARVGVPFPNDAVFAVRTHHQGPLRGKAFAFERTQGEQRLLYRLRVLRGRGFAYLLAAWMNKKTEAASEFLDLAMNCVTFTEKMEAKPPLTDDRIRATHAGVWSDVGVALARANEGNAALPWFQRAYELDRSSVATLANYAETLIKLGRGPEALSMLDRYSVGDDRPILRRMRAQVLQANGKADEAIRVLSDLHKAAPADTETTVILIDAQLNAQRFADALAECDRLVATGTDAVGVLQRKGLAEAQLKRYRESIATLEKAKEKDPANADIKRLLEQVAALSGARPK